jgi:hypothetical protein
MRRTFEFGIRASSSKWGAGKTLAMALPVMMLDEGKIALTIVPLKLLQKNHVRTFVLTISN